MLRDHCEMGVVFKHFDPLRRGPSSNRRLSNWIAFPMTFAPCPQLYPCSTYWIMSVYIDFIGDSAENR